VLQEPHLSLPASGPPGKIVYWSCLGEFLPVDGTDQRLDRLRTAMACYIGDGLLAPFSALGPVPVQVWQLIEGLPPPSSWPSPLTTARTDWNDPRQGHGRRGHQVVGLLATNLWLMSNSTQRDRLRAAKSAVGA
jgi:hypothetical protein